MGFFSTLFGNNDRETFVIVGLGNPGAQYAHTRHNVGFDVTDELCRRWNLTQSRTRLGGQIWETTLGEVRVILCQPQTFMNLSGECVSQLLSWYKIPLDHLLVIYDDIDLPAARLRVRKNGSAGTHNGMRSILQHVSSKEFPRIRVGVGACPPEWELVKWVMSRYRSREEQQAMDEAFAAAADCAEDWVRNGIEHAMQRYNRKG